MAARGQSFSGMRGLAAVPSYVVMQPTTLCNLDCAYCYLPFRAVDRRMPVAVAEAVAAAVNPWAANGRFSVVWHGGEPLAAGREHLADLMAPFGPEVEHHVQTNATLDRRRLVRFLRPARDAGERERRRAPGAQRRPGQPGRSAGVRPDRARHRGAAPARSALLRAGRGVPPGAGAGHRAVRLLPRVGLRRAGHQHRGDRGGQHPRQPPRPVGGVRVLGGAGRGVAPGAPDPPSRDRVVVALRRGGARQLGGRAAAPSAGPDPDDRSRRLGDRALPGVGRFHRPPLRRLQQRQRADDPVGARSSATRRPRPGWGSS